jgi:thioesterase domain-containing protein
VRDNFFELGGHSLIAVRLFARMKKTFGVDYPISTLIEHPTIEACARLVAPSAELERRSQPPRLPSAEPTRMKHVVPMNPPGGETRGRLPFFLVGGMFGNVINLRHLAGLIGEDRPFHGVQARGLLGNEDPHETFEEMARDYLAELRAVQPHGPYLLGGFSGGGIAAYEMARQLIEAGEEVPLLVLLDTPLPKDEPLSTAERLMIHQQNLSQKGARYVLDWAQQKLAYRRQLRERAEEQVAQRGHDAANFRSLLIEAAFYRALERYDVRPLPVNILLCRPRLKAMHTFGPGRAINKDRRRIYHDNGWTPYGKHVEVFETPGDHDNMVLEPNVRILAAHLRPALDEAERQSRRQPSPDASTGAASATPASSRSRTARGGE